MHRDELRYALLCQTLGDVSLLTIPPYASNRARLDEWGGGGTRNMLTLGGELPEQWLLNLSYTDAEPLPSALEAAAKQAEAEKGGGGGGGGDEDEYGEDEYGEEDYGDDGVWFHVMHIITCMPPLTLSHLVVHNRVTKTRTHLEPSWAKAPNL